MKRFSRLAPLAAFLALSLSGCSSVQTTVSYPSANAKLGDRPIASLVVENNGYYLFGLFPLFSGNHEKRHNTVFFKDTVTLENNVLMLEEEAKKHGNVIIDDLVTVGGDYSIPYTIWLLSRRTLSTSANVYALAPSNTVSAVAPVQD